MTTPEGGKLILSPCTTRLDDFVFAGNDQTLDVRDTACNDICTLEAAEAIGCGEPIELADVVELVSNLVEKSLVTHEPAAAAHCGTVFVLRDGRVEGHIDTEGLDAGGVAARYQQLVRAA